MLYLIVLINVIVGTVTAVYLALKYLTLHIVEQVKKRRTAK